MTAMQRSVQWPMIGRDSELADLATTVVEEGTGAALFGPAGAGKSRLANELISLAVGRGMRPLRAVASRSAATIPLGALAPLLPASLPEGGELRAEVLRQVADAIAAEAMQESGRVLLVIDDAHLLDDASATVLHQLAVSGQVTILLTVRSGEPAPDPLLALWKDGLVRRYTIEHLDPDTVDRLLAHVLEGPLDGAARRDLFRASEGNPLLLRELVLGALETDQLADDDGVWRLHQLPAGNPRLAELVEARLAELERPERELLEVVALGEPLGPVVLGKVADTDMLPNLEERGLVLVVSDNRRQLVRLAHPLYGEVLRRRLPRFRVMEINRGLADAVESLGAQRRDDTLRVAVWRLDGGGAVKPELMLEGARLAHFAFDHELAERLAGAAYEAGGGVDAGLLLAEILTTVGKHEECEQLLRSLDPGDDPFARLGIAVSLSSVIFWGLGRHDDAVWVLASAEGELPEGPMREELIGFHSTLELLAGYPQRAIDVASTIMGSDQVRAIVYASIAAGAGLAICGQSERSLVIGRHAYEVNRDAGPQQMLAKPWMHQITQSLAMAEAGLLAEGMTMAEAGYDAALERREKAAQAWFATNLGRLTMVAGRVATSNRWFAEGAAAFRELGHHGQQRWCLAGRALATALLGITSTALMAEIDRLADTPAKMMEVDIERARGWQSVAAGEPDRGRELLRKAADLGLERGAYALTAAALHDLVRLGDHDQAVTDLLAVGERVDGELTIVRCAHADALRRGDGGALVEASAAFEGMGAMLLAAEASADAAAAFRRAGDQRKADSAERESARLAEPCEGASTPALRGVGPVVPLTTRQRDVALLAAQGLPSKEIAKRLNVSARTVDNHLQQIYRKLGVANRADLADAVGVITN